MTVQAALYSRASAAIPVTVEEQARGLRQIVGNHGWQVIAAHHDAGTGSKAGERRAGLTALLRGVDAGAYDVVAVHSLNLIGRDLANLVAFLATLKKANVRLIALTEGIDTGKDDCGHGLLEVGVLLADYVRFRRREAIIAGQHRARQQGVKFGRPPVPERRRACVRDALSAGMGVREAGRATGISPTSVLRIRDVMGGTGALADR